MSANKAYKSTEYILTLIKKKSKVFRCVSFFIIHSSRYKEGFSFLKIG
ncbi:hypothetical protein BafPKo_D0008 (plasmid) [Borreliella afzelii PKo]|uniref:Uncharacterized protein n=1 Tax=Borreliella afzelii (strain PKo) TaxID=390236 RepID=G0ITC4_BORAP|nr:hypothetical protein BafPKo_D0008 [Borreliella afzelii PKo]